MYYLSDLGKVKSIKQLQRETQRAMAKTAKAHAQALRAQAVPSSFDETWYVAEYPDIAAAISAGAIKSGWEHYKAYGQSEGRFPSAAAKYASGTPTKKQLQAAKREARKQAALAKRAERQAARQARQEEKKAGVDASVLAPGFDTFDQTGTAGPGGFGPAPVQDIFAPPVPGQYPPPVTGQCPIGYSVDPLSGQCVPIQPGQQQFPYPIQQPQGQSALYPFGAPTGQAPMMSYPQQQMPYPQQQYQPQQAPQEQVAETSIESSDTDSQEEAEAQPQVAQDDSQEQTQEGDTDMQAGLTGLADLGKKRRAKCQPSYGFPTVAAYRRACNKARKTQGVKWVQKQCACIDQYGRMIGAQQLLPGQQFPYPPGACPAGYSTDPATGQCVPIQPGQQCPPGYLLAMTPTGPQCQVLQQNFQPPYYGGGQFGPVSYGGGPQFDDPYGMQAGLAPMTGAQYGTPFPTYTGMQPGGGAGAQFMTEAAGIEAGAGDGDTFLPADYVPFTGAAGPPLPSTEDASVAAGQVTEESSGETPDFMSGLGYGPQTPKGGNPFMPVISRSRFLPQMYSSLYPAAQGVDLYPISGSNPLYPDAQGTNYYPDSEATGLDARLDGLGELTAAVRQSKRARIQRRQCIENCRRAMSGLGALYPAAQGTDLYPISGSNPLYPAAQGTNLYCDAQGTPLNPRLGAVTPGEESGLVGMLITGGLLYGLFRVFCKNS